MAVYFRNTNIAPHGGFFFETHGERVQAAHFCDMERPVRALMAKYRIPGSVEQVVAEYMCPRIPEAGWMCTGAVRKQSVYPKEAMANSERIVPGRQVVPFDVLSERLRACMSCPMHTREFCVTCTGHMERIMLLFNGRRVSVPEDRGSGICKCCKAYESAIASVEYGKDEPVWENAPGTCWRRKQ